MSIETHSNTLQTRNNYFLVNLWSVGYWNVAWNVGCMKRYKLPPPYPPACPPEPGRRRPGPCPFTYIYIYTYISSSLSLYIYIYIQFICFCVFLYIIISCLKDLAHVRAHVFKTNNDHVTFISYIHLYASIPTLRSLYTNSPVEDLAHARAHALRPGPCYQ